MPTYSMAGLLCLRPRPREALWSSMLPRQVDQPLHLIYPPGSSTLKQAVEVSQKARQQYPAFSTARVRPPRATLLPLVHAPGRALFSPCPRELHQSMRRAAGQPCQPPAGRRAARVCRTGQVPGDGQQTTTCRAKQDGWLRPRGTVSNAMAHAYDASKGKGQTVLQLL